MRFPILFILVTIAAVAALVVLYPTKFGRRYLVPAFYRGGRPTAAGRRLNRSWSWVTSTGVLPERWPGQPAGPVTIETIGRASGLPCSNMVTWIEYDGERYLVSMLGERSDWVRNARAASGEAVIRRGRRESVHLIEVPVVERAPIIRAWYKVTSSSTLPHLGLDPNSDIAEFDRIAPAHPVFRIVSRDH